MTEFLEGEKGEIRSRKWKGRREEGDCGHFWVILGSFGGHFGVGSGNLGPGKEERKGSGWVLEGEREKSGPGRGKEGEKRGIVAILGLIWGHLEAILGREVGIWVLEGEKEANPPQFSPLLTPIFPLFPSFLPEFPPPTPIIPFSLPFPPFWAYFPPLSPHLPPPVCL